MGAGSPPPALTGGVYLAIPSPRLLAVGSALGQQNQKAESTESLPVITQFKIKAQGKNAMTPECFRRRLFKVYCVIGATYRAFRHIALA